MLKIGDILGYDHPSKVQLTVTKITPEKVVCIGVSSGEKSVHTFSRQYAESFVVVGENKKLLFDQKIKESLSPYEIKCAGICGPSSKYNPGEGWQKVLVTKLFANDPATVWCIKSPEKIDFEWFEWEEIIKIFQPHYLRQAN